MVMVVVIPLVAVVVAFLLVRIIHVTQPRSSAAFLYLLVMFLTGFILVTWHVADSTMSASNTNECGTPDPGIPGSDFWVSECQGYQMGERIDRYRHFGSFWLWLLAPPGLRPACGAVGTEVCERLVSDPAAASWGTYLGRQFLGGLLLSLVLGGGWWLGIRYSDQLKQAERVKAEVPHTLDMSEDLPDEESE